MVVIEKSLKTITPKTNFCRRKVHLGVALDFTGFTMEPIKKIMKEVVDIKKRAGLGGEGF